MPKAIPPTLVSCADIIELGLDCKPVGSDARRLNGERYIDSEIYKARRDVQSIIHAHRPCSDPVRPQRDNTGMRNGTAAEDDVVSDTRAPDGRRASNRKRVRYHECKRLIIVGRRLGRLRPRHPPERGRHLSTVLLL